MKKFNYENRQYLEKLDELEESYYSKYIYYIKKNLQSNKSKFLDIGCGNGRTLKLLQNEGFVNGYGCDISKLFIKQAKNTGLKKVFYYNGENFPFQKSYFNLIGSFNVLEHIENPDEFLTSQANLLKGGGVLIVACPNFLSVLYRNNHRRLKGLRNKARNFKLIIMKLVNKNSSFEKIAPVYRKKFEYDDDAIVVTNIIDIRRNLQRNNFKIIYESGFINYNTNLFKFINAIPFIKYLLPSCFVVAQKIK